MASKMQIVVGSGLVSKKNLEEANRKHFWPLDQNGTGIEFFSDRYTVDAIDAIMDAEFRFPEEAQSVELVKMSMEELGFTKESATASEISEQAKVRGLRSMSLEEALELRLQYLDQPEEEDLILVIAPPVDSLFDAVTLGLSHVKQGEHDQLWFFVNSTKSDRRYEIASNETFAFAVAF